MVSVIKERLAVGEYSIDPQAVATAMLARCGGQDLGGCKGGRRPPLTALWSEVLVAAQPGDGGSVKRETFAGHDAA
jgi:hypothetical protein